jgi:hypothetical protein
MLRNDIVEQLSEQEIEPIACKVEEDLLLKEIKELKTLLSFSVVNINNTKTILEECKKLRKN